jgi:hypothetical protein
MIETFTTKRALSPSGVYSNGPVNNKSDHFSQTYSKALNYSQKNCFFRLQVVDIFTSKQIKKVEVQFKQKIGQKIFQKYFQTNEDGICEIDVKFQTATITLNHKRNNN